MKYITCGDKMATIGAWYRILGKITVSRTAKEAIPVFQSCRSLSKSVAKCARGGHNRQSATNHDGPHQTSPKRIQDLTINKALQTVKAKLADFGIKNTECHLFLGTGQYFHKSDRDRILVLNSESGLHDFGIEASSRDFIEPLLDCSLQSTEVDTFSDELAKIVKNVYNGEVNAVDEGFWTHGFVVNDYLRIFSQNGLVSKLSHGSFEYATEREVQKIPINDISSLRVTLSDEPWNDQTLEIEHKDGSIVPLLTFGYENDYRDLAMLMVDTEWSVKAAAMLCLQLKKLSNRTVHLKLPKVLTIQGNPWVENRHDLWTKFFNRY